MKQKMSEETKAKLIYSGELAIFSILFLVLGILRLVGIIGYKSNRILVINWITIFGSSYVIFDFFFSLFNKKRKAKVSLLDKCLTLPLGLYMFVFDLICFISRPSNDNFYIYMLAIAFIYISIIYMIQAIYHFYHPVPGLLDDENEQNLNNEDNENNIEK